jgi:phosphate-selective porin
VTKPPLCFALILLAVCPAVFTVPGTASAQAERPDKAPWPGMCWNSSDGAVRVTLNTLVHLDTRAYFGDTASPGSFDVRRARLDFSGTVSDWLTFRLQAALEDSPYLRNAWVELGSDERFRVRVGQMKVPFSTAWLTQDANLNFFERAANTPIYPFLDRGVLLTGRTLRGALSYDFGAFNGAGVELDAPKGDTDDHKELVTRLFAQPFRSGHSRALQGLYLVADVTRSLSGAPTRRFETRGLSTPDVESLFWRWRTEQVIGSDVHSTDAISGWIGSRRRVGAEAHWLYGPFTASAEWVRVRYGDIQISHDYFSGSRRLLHEPVLERSGSVRQLVVWASLFLTGEHLSLGDSGWRQPAPLHRYVPGAGGAGAWEVVLRLSDTRSDRTLFDAVKVPGYDEAALPPGVVTVGAAETVTARVIEGAPHVREVTAGLNWTLNELFRLMLDVTHLWALDPGPGEGIVSAGNSELADPTAKNRLVGSETMAGMRLQVRF